MFMLALPLKHARVCASFRRLRDTGTAAPEGDLFRQYPVSIYSHQGAWASLTSPALSCVRCWATEASLILVWIGGVPCVSFRGDSDGWCLPIAENEVAIAPRVEFRRGGNVTPTAFADPTLTSARRHGK